MNALKFNKEIKQGTKEEAKAEDKPVIKLDIKSSAVDIKVAPKPRSSSLG